MLHGSIIGLACDTVHLLQLPTQLATPQAQSTDFAVLLAPVGMAVRMLPLFCLPQPTLYPGS